MQNPESINFQIESKEGLDTSLEVQAQFRHDKARHETDGRTVSHIHCLTEKKIPAKGSQSVEIIDVVVGLAGNLMASYLYDLIKEYLRGKKEIKKKKDVLVIETKNFKVKISSDQLDMDEINKLVKKLL